MAWSEKLASGRYRGRYRDRQGNVRSLPHTYTQPAEAERAATIKEDSVRRRPAASKRDAKVTCGQWLDEWAATRKVEPGTAERDASRIKRHIRPYWEDVPLVDVDRDAVVEWSEVLAATPSGRPKDGKPSTLSAGTVLRIVRVFSASMRAAVVAEKIDVSPCTYLELHQPEATDEHFLERDEFDRLTAASDELAAMVCRVGVGTGMRWGEIAGLHRRRIDLARRRVLVQEVHDLSRNEIKPYPKGRARRGVPITSELATTLEEWMAAHPPVQCHTRHRDGKRCRDSLLFASGAGAALNYNNFRRDHWNPAIADADLKGVSLHDLRHTYASWLIQDGVSIEQLSALLGHKSITTTQRYAHLADSGWAQVRQVLGDAEDLGEDAIRAAIARLAAEQPETWSSVAEALTGAGDEKAAPDLLHKEDQPKGGKIIQLDRFRRSTGS
jgi:integrase